MRVIWIIAAREIETRSLAVSHFSSAKPPSRAMQLSKLKAVEMLLNFIPQTVKGPNILCRRSDESNSMRHVLHVQPIGTSAGNKGQGLTTYINKTISAILVH